MGINLDDISRMVSSALIEDAVHNDVTSKFTLHGEKVKFQLVAHEALILCGMDIVKYILNNYADKKINYVLRASEGSYLDKNTVFVDGEGDAAILFSLERVMLNFLQHTSAIASVTNQFIAQIKGYGAALRNTRKTTPGLRALECYAVRIGGGQSLRNNLEDKILIKDNHIASAGSVKEVLDRVRANTVDAPIGLECDTLDQVEAAMASGHKVDLILLDNMSVDMIKCSVDIVARKAKIEVSGGVNLSNIRSIAMINGVDYISSGFITQSAGNKDIGLDVRIC